MGLQWLLSPASHKDNLCPDFVLRHGQYGREDLMVGEGKVRRVGSLQSVQLYRQGSLDPRLRAHQLYLQLELLLPTLEGFFVNASGRVTFTSAFSRAVC